MNPSVAFVTLGCKLNQAESEQLECQFNNEGYHMSDNGKADIFIINTCTVTHIADRKARHALRYIRKNNPDSFIVVTGCYADTAAEDLKKLGADLVAGNKSKGQLLSLIKKSAPFPIEKRVVPVHSSRVRSFIKIQDGCRNFCSYCIVPHVRNKEYSVPVSETISRINERINLGYNEVVLTGTRIGAYNHSGLDLTGLTKRILDETGIKRLHLSSLQPEDIGEGLLSLWSDNRLCRHFHIALQSGSDSVLGRMRREYSIADYRNSISLIRSLNKRASVTTDIMVGFPGETEEEFNESYEFCKEVGFAAIHVFSYSRRPGTAAAAMLTQVHDKIKKRRSLSILKLAKESTFKFAQDQVGQNMDVLFENEEKPGTTVYSGYSQNYIRVYVKSAKPLTNLVLPVRMVRPFKEGLLGELNN